MCVCFRTDSNVPPCSQDEILVMEYDVDSEFLDDGNNGEDNNEDDDNNDNPCPTTVPMTQR